MSWSLRFFPKGTAYRQGMTAMYQGVATDNQTAYINGTGNVPANPTYYHPDSVHLKDCGPASGVGNCVGGFAANPVTPPLGAPLICLPLAQQAVHQQG